MERKKEKKTVEENTGKKARTFQNIPNIEKLEGKTTLKPKRTGPDTRRGRLFARVEI